MTQSAAELPSPAKWRSLSRPEFERRYAADPHIKKAAAQLSTPTLHRDPFDRMLICQTLQNGLVIATVDAAIRAYSVSII